jgi:hypothetical protein
MGGNLNMLKKFGLALLLSTALAAQASAAGCVLEQALHNIEYGAIQLNAEYARETIPILDEMHRLLPNNSTNNLPTGLQLSARASQRFEKISFDLLKIRSQGMILSAYVRDARVIGRAAQVARNMLNGKDYTDKDPDYFYFQILAFTTVAYYGTLEGKLDFNPSTDDCSLDSGLWSSEESALNGFNAVKTNEAWDRVLATARQFKIDTRQEGWFSRLDSIPSFPARKQAQADLRMVQGLSKVREHTKSIEALRALNQVSLRIYSTHRADINASRKDKADLENRFGSTWEAELKASDDRTKRLEGVIRIVQEKMPSDSMIQSQQMLDVVKKIESTP